MARIINRTKNSYIKEYKDGSTASFVKNGVGGRAVKMGSNRVSAPKRPRKK